MADAAVPPSGGSIQNTALVGISAGGGVAFLIYICNPTWPPPDAILALVWGACLPVIHLIGRGIYRRIAKWSGEPVAPQPTQPGDQAHA